MKTIGFIGLGIMGRPMVKNLLKAGFVVIGYDINPDFVAEVEKAGARGARSIAQLAPQCDAIITILPKPAASLEVALGQGGLSAHAKAGCLVIEMSSLAPTTAQEIAAGLSRRHINFMDAPVSGGE
ncbi:MAG: NAD(P)-binding domain-containing protein, partial [Candidatus Adiutrix sp.]